jgi:hypothetical protein
MAYRMRLACVIDRQGPVGHDPCRRRQLFRLAGAVRAAAARASPAAWLGKVVTYINRVARNISRRRRCLPHRGCFTLAVGSALAALSITAPAPALSFRNPRPTSLHHGSGNAPSRTEPSPYRSRRLEFWHHTAVDLYAACAAGGMKSQPHKQSL